MSKLDLIRAGHTEVADGQCWLCDVPWPCDTGVVLAALTAAEARAEQAEQRYQRARAETFACHTETLRERNENVRLRERAEQAERERDAADEEAQNARSVAQMAASDRDEAMDNFDNLSLELERLEKQLTADNAALRERLATVEAALLIADELSDDLEDVAQELANRTHGQPRYEPIIRAALQTVTRYNEARAALAATPAAGEVE